MTEDEILRFNDELLALLEKFDPSEDPARERILGAMLLGQTVAMASAGELTKNEFLRDCAEAWDLHWKLFNAARDTARTRS